MTPSPPAVLMLGDDRCQRGGQFRGDADSDDVPCIVYFPALAFGKVLLFDYFGSVPPLRRAIVLNDLLLYVYVDVTNCPVVVET